MVDSTCKQCGKTYRIKPSQLGKSKYCSKLCTNDSFKTKFLGENNPAFGKTYRSKTTHPEWAAKISTTHKLSDRMVGDANPMKRSDVASKMSKTRRERVTSDPDYRKERSDYTRKAWAEGKYDGVKVGKCKWYTHVKPDGSVIKLQGTWEVVLARHMDSINLQYEAHSGRIPYFDHEGTERSYYPDFYIPAFESFLDVKGAFFDDIQEHKFDHIRASNPEITIVIVNRSMFETFGINIDRESSKILQ